MALIRSMPLLPDNEISTMTRSGFDRLIPSSASVASAASPHTFRSASRSMSCFSPSRNIAWSSTIKIRFFSDNLVFMSMGLRPFMVNSIHHYRLFPASSDSFRAFWRGRIKHTSDLGALTGPACQVQSGADDPGAVAHDADAHPRVVAPGRCKSRTIILVWPARDVHPGTPGRC